MDSDAFLDEDVHQDVFEAAEQYGVSFGYLEVAPHFPGIADGMSIARVWVCRYSK